MSANMPAAMKKTRMKIVPQPPSGILPAQAIRGLIDDGVLSIAAPLVDKQLQPASIDLRLGDVAYRVRASFLAGPGTTVESKLAALSLHEIPLAKGAVWS